MTGVIATALVAHVPTLGQAQNTPDYQQTLVQAERKLGAAMRAALKPDLCVLVSTHWVSTFNWFATCQPMPHIDPDIRFMPMSPGTKKSM